MYMIIKNKPQIWKKAVRAAWEGLVRENWSRNDAIILKLKKINMKVPRGRIL